jgi:uncharacterized caspase-like protein
VIRGPDSAVRRRLLQGGLAAGSLFLPTPWMWVWAQSEGAAKLLRAPKMALVVGNAAYRNVNVLRNSGNDARALADALRACGFDVTLVQDAPRREMLDAIGAYTRALAARKAVGVFYFAGHGAQLDWRNYLLPVDANVVKPGDIASQCVDLSTLIAGLREAANPMNLIVLDACRDNPFGPAAGLEQKGLSQMDAPLRTLLAYATAPGNGADDGPGANGLYTESLLREMKVREARIEDVFKRVRLGVRRASGGRQVPWESTSLEEDFYFLPPDQLRKLSAQEEEREFAEELAMFEGARRAREPAPIEAYLRRYPSGRFAELAQLRLDQVLAQGGERRVEAVSAEGNPFTAGTARADTRFRVGDSFTYDRIDKTLFGKKPERFTTAVTAITDEHVLFDGGEAIRDLLGNQLRFRNGNEVTPRQDQPLEYAIGKKWSTRYELSNAGRSRGSVILDFRVVARETITVPAGTFDCFRIEASGVNRLPGRPDIELGVARWDAPGRVRLAVARDEIRRRVVKGHVEDLRSERIELVSFEQR